MWKNCRSSDNLANVTVFAPVNSAFEDSADVAGFDLREYVGKGMLVTNMPERKDTIQVLAQMDALQ